MTGWTPHTKKRRSGEPLEEVKVNGCERVAPKRCVASPDIDAGPSQSTRMVALQTEAIEQQKRTHRCEVEKLPSLGRLDALRQALMDGSGDGKQVAPAAAAAATHGLSRCTAASRSAKPLHQDATVRLRPTTPSQQPPTHRHLLRKLDLG